MRGRHGCAAWPRAVLVGRGLLLLAHYRSSLKSALVVAACMRAVALAVAAGTCVLHAA
jgi:hypothetical protein